ncbi:MAG: hypothetical protein IKE01_00815 [Clostridia bacterium]|nr:hypothetical protein [Clostridia bacterium]
MARTRVYDEQKGTFDGIEKLNNSPKRKSAWRRILEAIKSLSKDDDDFVSEPVNKYDEEKFRAYLMSIKNPELKEDYKSSLRASNGKKKVREDDNKKNREIDLEIGE